MLKFELCTGSGWSVPLIAQWIASQWFLALEPSLELARFLGPTAGGSVCLALSDIPPPKGSLYIELCSLFLEREAPGVSLILAMKEGSFRFLCTRPHMVQDPSWPQCLELSLFTWYLFWARMPLSVKKCPGLALTHVLRELTSVRTCLSAPPHTFTRTASAVRILLLLPAVALSLLLCSFSAGFGATDSCILFPGHRASGDSSRWEYAHASVPSRPVLQLLPLLIAFLWCLLWPVFTVSSYSWSRRVIATTKLTTAAFNSDGSFEVWSDKSSGSGN